MQYLKFNMGALTCFLLLISLAAFSTQPTWPYAFCAPDFNNILPFTKTELKTFKEKGIKRVEVRDANIQTIYYLNDQGQLSSSEEIWIKRKNKTVIGNTKYKYDNSGLLTVIHITGKHYFYHDSLSYDEKGRVIHFYSYYKILNGKKKCQKVISYNLQIVSSDENKVILVDSSQNFVQFYTLDNANHVQLIHSQFRTDSVSIDPDGDSGFIKKYWYKENMDTVFRVGQEFIYKDGYLQTETLWDTYYDKRVVYKTHYTYDQTGRLLRKENEYRYQPKVFYTYNDIGLLMEQITVKMDLATIKTFNYYFN